MPTNTTKLNNLYQRICQNTAKKSVNTNTKSQCTIDCERLIKELYYFTIAHDTTTIKSIKADLLSNTVIVKYVDGTKIDLLKTLQAADINSIESDITMLYQAWASLTKTAHSESSCMQNVKCLSNNEDRQYTMIHEILKYISNPSESSIANIKVEKDELILITYKNGIESSIYSGDSEIGALVVADSHISKQPAVDLSPYEINFIKHVFDLLNQDSTLRLVSSEGNDKFYFENNCMKFSYDFSNPNEIIFQQEQKSNLTLNETTAINNYTGYTYNAIWHSMGVHISAIQHLERNVIDEVSMLIQAMSIGSGLKKLKAETTASLEDQYFIMGEFPENYNQYKKHLEIGEPLTLKTYSSSTTEYEVAARFTSPEQIVFVIFKNPNGADISDFSNFPQEKEFLVMPGQFQVTGELVEDGITYFTVEQI